MFTLEVIETLFGWVSSNEVVLAALERETTPA
jgi:hypothetical protein